MADKYRWELGDFISTGRTDLDDSWAPLPKSIDDMYSVNNSKLFNTIEAGYGYIYDLYHTIDSSLDSINNQNFLAIGQSPEGEIYILTRVNGTSAITGSNTLFAYKISPNRVVTKVTSSLSFNMNDVYGIQQALYVNGAYYSFAAKSQPSSTSTTLTTTYFIIKCDSSGLSMHQFSGVVGYGSSNLVPTVCALGKYVYLINCGNNRLNSQPSTGYSYYTIKRLDTTLGLSSIKEFNLQSLYSNIYSTTVYWALLGGYLYIRDYVKKTTSNNSFVEYYKCINLMENNLTVITETPPNHIISQLNYIGAAFSAPFFDGKTYLKDMYNPSNYLYTDDTLPTKNIKVHFGVPKSPERGNSYLQTFTTPFKYGLPLYPSVNSTPGKIILKRDFRYSRTSKTTIQYVAYEGPSSSSNSTGNVASCNYGYIIIFETVNYTKGRISILKCNQSTVILPIKYENSLDTYMKISD